jgi:hypothetical protein
MFKISRASSTAVCAQPHGGRRAVEHRTLAASATHPVHRVSGNNLLLHSEVGREPVKNVTIDFSLGWRSSYDEFFERMKIENFQRCGVAVLHESLLTKKRAQPNNRPGPSSPRSWSAAPSARRSAPRRPSAAKHKATVSRSRPLPDLVLPDDAFATSCLTGFARSAISRAQPESRWTARDD